MSLNIIDYLTNLFGKFFVFFFKFDVKIKRRQSHSNRGPFISQSRILPPSCRCLSYRSTIFTVLSGTCSGQLVSRRENRKNTRHWLTCLKLLVLVFLLSGRKYANITRPMIEKFLGMCEVCAGKKTKRKRGLVTKPILHKQLNSRCQVDLVDMQSQEIQGKRFILNYQDHLTKFIQLRALSHKTAEEVAAHLKDIFLTFGAPCILHSDNGREFVNNIIKCMKIHWPELQLVNGKPRHSQSQGSIERANQDVENMLAAWLIDKKTNQWPDALPFIQFMKNRAYHAGIRMSP